MHFAHGGKYAIFFLSPSLFFSLAKLKKKQHNVHSASFVMANNVSMKKKSSDRALSVSKYRSINGNNIFVVLGVLH